jgi:hypothetical protein
VIINVHLRYTVFQFVSRHDLVKVLPPRQEVAEGVDKVGEPKVVAWARDKGDPTNPEWRRTIVRRIRRPAIDYIVNAEDEAKSDADLPAKEVAEHRQRRHAELDKANQQPETAKAAA